MLQCIQALWMLCTCRKDTFQEDPTAAHSCMVLLSGLGAACLKIAPVYICHCNKGTGHDFERLMQDNAAFVAAWKGCSSASAVRHLDVEAPQLFQVHCITCRAKLGFVLIALVV